MPEHLPCQSFHGYKRERCAAALTQCTRGNAACLHSFQQRSCMEVEGMSITQHLLLGAAIHFVRHAILAV